MRLISALPLVVHIGLIALPQRAHAHTGFDPLCPEATAQNVFDTAVCVCGDYRGAATLTADSLGVNGSAQSNAHVVVDGNVTVSGAGGVQSSSTIDAGNLAVQGDIRSNGSIRVTHDAQLAGNVWANKLEVLGQTFLDPAASLHANDGALHINRAPVHVDPPCSCDAGLIDMATVAAAAAQSNDNASAGLTSSSLGGFSQAQNITLAAGSFYLEAIRGDAPVALHIVGRTSLFVAGDIAVNHPVQINVDPNASLDLFVQGSITVTNTFVVASSDLNSARLWVQGELFLADGIDFTGLLYAPTSAMNLSGNANVTGALLVGQLNHNKPLGVAYASTAGMANTCDPTAPAPPPPPPTTTPPPPPTTTPPLQTCESCGDCDNSGACNSGVCVPCNDAAPCCEGYLCDGNGLCVRDNQ